MVIIFRLIALSCLLALWCGLAHAADVTAQLDRNRIVEGETVTLVIQTTDPQQRLDGDFTALDADFEVLDQRSETQMSITNGRQAALVRLMITLEPRHSGELTIPALQFGAASTRPLSLTVEPAPEPEPGDAPTVFIEVEVQPRDGPFYVHAQLLLTVRVFYQQSLTEAAISQPEPTPASVRLLDEVPFQADRGGQRYKVLERHYAIFPERSGPLQIPPMKLSGRVVERRSDRLWQPTVRGRRIEVSSDPVDLVIQPKPPGFTGDAWLPARSLQLTQTVSAGNELTVGEPVTRTVIVDAVGLEENMITAPPWPDLADVRIYPDQPQGISRNDGNWVLGHKEFRYAVVPEQAGELVLPELKLEWWDTVNDRLETAVLPEKRFRVKPSAAMPAPPPAPATPVADETPAVFEPPARSAASPGSYWTWLTFVFAALWLGTLGLLLRRRQQAAGAAVQAQTGADPAEADMLAGLKRACEAGDAAQVRRSLGRWLRTYGPDSGSGSLLRFAENSASEELAACLVRLDAAGFRAAESGSWDGRELWKAFRGWRTRWQAERKRAEPNVTDLYARPGA